MRIRCDFKTKELPLSHNLMFVSLIKEALKKSDIGYYEKLYTFEGKANKKSKNFCFSVKMLGYDLEGDIAAVKDKVSLFVSSPDTEFLLYLYNGLLKITEFSYKMYKLQRSGISMVKEKDVNSEEIVFKTFSPICVKNTENHFMKIEDEGFERELNYIAGKVLEHYRGEGLREKLAFQDVKMKNVVVRQELRAFEEKTGRNYLCVNSYEGIFKLSGNVQDLKDLYMLGLGFKRSQGFGMLDVVY